MTAILSPFGSGGGYQPWQFHVAPLGGGADDTANVQAAITSAVTYMANNRGYAEVILDPALYTLSSALSNAGNGNSQLRLPTIGTNVAGNILNIRTTSGNGGTNPMFGSTVPQLSGCILKSTLTGQANDATFGPPNILGGPYNGFSYGTGNYTNITVIIDGITCSVPFEASGPTMAGLFLGSCARAELQSYAYIPNATVATLNATEPTNFWVTGCYLPYPLNNDLCVIGSYAAYGAKNGLYATSHLAANRIACLYCHTGLLVVVDSDGHGIGVNNLSIELCTNAIEQGGSSFASPIWANLDCEQIAYYGTGYHLLDTGNQLAGTVHLNTLGGGGSAVLVNGAANVEVIAANQARGIATPPAVPATTVALKNPFWRHATVNLTSGGGAVTAIAVNGTATGLTLGVTGTVEVRVPSGATITLTYAAAAPTWTWNLD